MTYDLHRRAEIALQSLGTQDRDRVLRALGKFDGDGWREDDQVTLLRGTPSQVTPSTPPPAPQGPEFVMRASDRLRIVFSEERNKILVLDISTPEKIGT